MERGRTHESVFQSVFTEGGSSASDAKIAALGKQTASGVDLSSEDAEIAALMAELSEEHARLDSIGKQLREHPLNAQVCAAEHLVTPPRADTPSSDEERQVPTGSVVEVQRLDPSFSIPFDKLRGDSVSTKLDSRRPACEETRDPWDMNKGMLRPLKFSASTGKLGKDALSLGGYPKSKSGVQKAAGAPIKLSPESILFADCHIGQAYKDTIEIQNTSKKAVHLRILPCTNRAFTNDPIRYDSATRRKMGVPGSTIPPGQSVYLTVHFSAKSLDDQVDQLLLTTESGNVSLTVQARNVLPPSLGAR